MSSSRNRARICGSFGFSGNSGNFSSTRSFCPSMLTSRLGRFGMGTASAGFFCKIFERTKYLPKLFNAARCSQMLVGASFCLIFKSHTKFLTLISENAARGIAFAEVASCVAFLFAGPFPAIEVQYFSSDFRYVMTVFSEYLRCVCRYIKKFWMYSSKSIVFYSFREEKYLF